VGRTEHVYVGVGLEGPQERPYVQEFPTPGIVTNMAKLEEVTQDKRTLYEESATSPGEGPTQPVEKLEHYLDRLKGATQP